jgi:hypothetical protein
LINKKKFCCSKKNVVVYLPKSKDRVDPALPDLPQLLTGQKEPHEGVDGHKDGDQPVRPLFGK